MKKNVFSRFVRSKSFSMIFIFISILLIFYTAIHLNKIIEAVFSIKIFSIILTLLFIYFAYMLIYEKSKKNYKKSHKLYAFCSFILCFLLNIVQGFIIVDFLNIFLPMPIYAYLIALYISILITFLAMIHANNIIIKNESITIGNTKNVKIAFLSDIHIGHFIKINQLDKMIKKINSLDADYILIGGDVFNDDAFNYLDIQLFSNKLKELKPSGKVYTVLGNHDPNSLDSRIYDFFKEANINLLVDYIIELKDFYIVGRDDITSNPNRETLTSLLKNINIKKPLIVLDHNPLGVNEAIENQVDILLCGHTHQGQFFPATLFTKLSYGKISFYGYHQEKNTHILVSSGIGYFQMPMRIGTSSEVVLLNIRL